MNFRRFLPGPVFRLALGVVTLLLCLLMALDLLVGLMPDRYDEAVRIRTRIAESLAIQLTALMQNESPQAMTSMLRELLERDDELQSLALRRADGKLLAQAGPHDELWNLAPDAPSTITDVRVPLNANRLPWGDVELTFSPIHPTTVAGWLQDPLVRALGIVGITGVTLMYLYLRRALQYLDPGSAVPPRVRAAFDTLREGVMLLDAEDRVVLTNRAFSQIHPAAQKVDIGTPVKSLAWLTKNLGPKTEDWPWRLVARTREKMDETLFEIPMPDDEPPRRVVLNASPILDGDGRYRACMVSLADVSMLHQANEQLLQTIQALDESSEKIRQQNDELKRLATSDPLTGCMNRRAFYEHLSSVMTKANATGAPVGCIMTDIDHFKNFNDTYGHAVGDQVLVGVSNALKHGIREQDLLCRYGGEEFCLIMPGLDIDGTAAVAERLRKSIEEMAGSSLRTTGRLKVTSSFGVSQLAAGSLDEGDMIQRADAALYEAKRGGRNRVATEGQVTPESLAK
ncbi:sensor domain-containing diguanylate cyclase [Nitrogeniibacter aestuarii]|uniref:sensor domain-containing diguanylate cyclase n=1 Tax=Nitrogeniibacter aestuarii TaxID=2815343 RepID=UPI001D119D5F|nr:sensor domain-containing diguanylate cyclase [Nitrogeniibacter aestuarii]